MSVKIITRVKKIVVGILEQHISEGSRYWKSTLDDSVIVTVTNATSTVTNKFCDEKVRYKMDFNIVHPFLLVTMFSIISCHCTKHNISVRSIILMT